MVSSGRGNPEKQKYVTIKIIRTFENELPQVEVCPDARPKFSKVNVLVHLCCPLKSLLF
jgi:hypothetical protein